MIGPSLGTYSPPMIRTSVKKESTARPEMKRIKRCKGFVSEEAIQETESAERSWTWTRRQLAAGQRSCC